MKLSMKSRYGLRAMIDLAVHGKSEQVPLNVISERNEISHQFLEQVFSAFKRAGLVRSVKGPQGGYSLNRPAAEISALEIIEAIEGTYEVAPEEGKEISRVIQTLVVAQMNQRVRDYLGALTLEQMEEEYLALLQSGQDMYYI